MKQNIMSYFLIGITSLFTLGACSIQNNGSWGAIILLIKLIGMLAFICIVRAIIVHMNIQKQIARLQAQGITSYPGNDTFLTGPVKALEAQYFKQAAENAKDSPLPVALIWML